MRHWQYYLVVLLLILVSSSGSTLDDTCKTVAANNKNIGYGCFIKFLQANNASATADNRGLNDIATKISRAVALDIRKRIDAHMASKKDKKIHGCLSDCRALYSAAVNMLELTANLNAMIAGINTYEEGFRMLGMTSPLAAEDAKFIKDRSIVLINELVVVTS